MYNNLNNNGGMGQQGMGYNTQQYQQPNNGGMGAYDAYGNPTNDPYANQGLSQYGSGIEAPHVTDKRVADNMSALSTHVNFVSEYMGVEMTVGDDGEENLTYIEVDSKGEDIFPFSIAQQGNETRFRIYIISKDMYTISRQAGANPSNMYTNIMEKTRGRVAWITPNMYGNGDNDLRISLIRVIKSMMPYYAPASENFSEYEIAEFSQNIPVNVAAYDFNLEGGNEQHLNLFETFVANNYTSVDIAPAADKVYMLTYNEIVNPGQALGGGMFGGFQQPAGKTHVMAAITVTMTKQKTDNVQKVDCVITAYLEPLTQTYKGAFKELVHMLIRDIASEGAMVSSINVASNPCIPAEIRLITETTSNDQIPALTPNAIYSTTEYWYVPKAAKAYSIEALSHVDTLHALFPSGTDQAKIEKLDSKTDIDKFLTAKSCTKFSGPATYVIPANQMAFMNGGQGIGMSQGIGQGGFASGFGAQQQQPQMGQQQGYGQQMQQPGFGQQQQPMGFGGQPQQQQFAPGMMNGNPLGFQQQPQQTPFGQQQQQYQQGFQNQYNY